MDRQIEANSPFQLLLKGAKRETKEWGEENKAKQKQTESRMFSSLSMVFRLSKAIRAGSLV